MLLSYFFTSLSLSRILSAMEGKAKVFFYLFSTLVSSMPSDGVKNPPVVELSVRTERSSLPNPSPYRPLMRLNVLKNHLVGGIWLRPNRATVPASSSFESLLPPSGLENPPVTEIWLRKDRATVSASSPSNSSNGVKKATAGEVRVRHVRAPVPPSSSSPCTHIPFIGDGHCSSPP